MILSRNGYVDYPEAPYDITILDKRTFPEWFERMRAISSPLKAQQLKGHRLCLNIAKLHPACDLNGKRSITKRMEISMPHLKETVYFIVNPMAGNGESLKVWKKPRKYCNQKLFPMRCFYTGKGACAKIDEGDPIRDEAGYPDDRCRGDGTINEMINGAIGFPTLSSAPLRLDPEMIM